MTFSIRSKKTKTNKGVSQCRTFDTIDSLLYYVKITGVGYEEGMDNCIPYGDYDNKYDNESAQKSEWGGKLNEIYLQWQEAYPTGKVMMFCASGYDVVARVWKNSYHVRVREAGFYKCGSVIPHLLDVDSAPYKCEGKVGLFRLPYCSKEKDTKRILRRVHSVNGIWKHFDLENIGQLGESYTDYLIFNIEGENEIVIPKDYENIDFSVAPDATEIKKIKLMNKQHSTIQTKKTIEELKLITDCLSDERLNDWKQWLKVIRVLKNIGCVNELIHSVSARSAKYDRREVDEFISRIDTTPCENKLSVGSLCYWASQDNPTKYNDCLKTALAQEKNSMKLHIHNASESPRKYEYNDMFQFKNQSFPDMAEVVKFLFDSIVHVVDRGNHRVFTVTINKDGNLEYTQIMAPMFMGLNDMDIFVDGENISMRYVFVEFYAYKHYKNLDFVPYLAEDPCVEGEFNMFEGYTFKYTRPEDSKYNTGCLTGIIYHIKEIICGGDEIAFIWMMKWINDLFTDPARKKGYAILLQSPEQGTGKNLFVELLVKILGIKLYYKASSIDGITARFNEQLANKLLVLGDELANFSTHRDSDKIKDAITCNQRSIEPKGKEIYNITACERYIFTSNSDLPLRVENTDRRFMCCRVSASKVGDSDYFDSLARDIDNVNIQKTFFLWICHNPEWQSKGFKFSNIPQTELRKELIRGQFDNYLDFIEDYINSKITKFSDTSNFTTSTDMYNDYKTWCDSQGERPTTSQKLLKNLVKDCKLTQIRKRVNGSNKVRGFSINLSELEEEIIKLTKNKSFKFDDRAENIPGDESEDDDVHGKNFHELDDFD